MNPINITKLVDDYASLSAQMKILTDLTVAAKSKLLALGEGCYEGTARKVIISTAIPIKFDSAALKSEHPDLHAKFSLPGTAVTSARIYNR